MKPFVFLSLCLLGIVQAHAQSYDYDMTQRQPLYSDATGFGYDVIGAPSSKSNRSFFFSVKVPDGNYRVTVTLGSKKKVGHTVVRAEARRLFVEMCNTPKGKFKAFSFLVNKRSPFISDHESVKIKPREKESLDWDDRLTLEFNGPAPAVKEIRIERAPDAPTLYLCGNSTVVDQAREPWASWGQMVTRWFNDQVAVSNHAESGLTATSFLAQNRLDKISSTLKKGDYVFCEFGHNDQKEKGPGAGAYYNFSFALKKFIDIVRAKGATIVFVTPTQRRFFDENGKIRETHGDYPEAMRAVARREKVPVIELHNMTRTFFEALGIEDSKRALVHYPAGTFAGQTKDLADNTHFNPYGAYEVAKMVVMGMKDLGLPVVKDIRKDWKDYDPTHPDDPKAFSWYPCVINDFMKPDGN